MRLAEGPQIDGGVLVIILVLFLVFAAVVIGGIVAGFIWAGRAGRGSDRAFAGWVCVALIEGAATVKGLLDFARDGHERGLRTAVVAGTVLGLQAGIYTLARRGRDPSARDR